MGLEKAKSLMECQQEYSTLCGEYGHAHSQIAVKKGEIEILHLKLDNLDTQIKAVLAKATELQSPKEAPPAETITDEEKKDEVSNG